jgi:hypothetical protein
VIEKAGGLSELLPHNSTAAISLPEPANQAAGLPWYAICAKPNFELVSARLLRAKGFDEYLPMYCSRRRWSDHVKEIEVPLFPQYIFCRMGHSAAIELA